MIVAMNILLFVTITLAGKGIVCQNIENSDSNGNLNSDVRTLNELSSHGHQMDSGIKEKRCNDLPSLDFYENIVGSVRNPKLALPLSLTRRDLQADIMKKNCQNCKNLCKKGNCEWCTKICKDADAHLDIKERAAKETVGIASRMNAQESETGLSESQERYYSVGSFGPGPKQSLLARLLNIPRSVKLDRLIVLAKNKSKNPAAPSLPNPVIIDTAHVFTLNDGTPAALDTELHNVKTNGVEDFNQLTGRLNKELDAAIETKKNMFGDSHLTPVEIDKIIEHATAQKSVDTSVRNGLVGAKLSEDIENPETENSKSIMDDKLRVAEEDDTNMGFKKGHKKKKHRFSGSETDDIIGSAISTVSTDEVTEKSLSSDMDNLENGERDSINDSESNFKKGKKKHIGLVGAEHTNLNDENGSHSSESFDNMKSIVGLQQNLNDQDNTKDQQILEHKHKKYGKKYGYRANEASGELAGAAHQNLNAEGEIDNQSGESLDDTKIIGLQQAFNMDQDTPDNSEDQHILEHKHKKFGKKHGKKYGYGYGYRENEDSEEQQKLVGATHDNLNAEGEIDNQSGDLSKIIGLQQDLNDEQDKIDNNSEDQHILEHKHKKFGKKHGKKYGYGYGYRQNEESEDDQKLVGATHANLNPEGEIDNQSDDNPKIIGIQQDLNVAQDKTDNNSQDQQILEHKHKKFGKKHGKKYDYGYRENDESDEAKKKASDENQNSDEVATEGEQGVVGSKFKHKKHGKKYGYGQYRTNDDSATQTEEHQSNDDLIKDKSDGVNINARTNDNRYMENTPAGYPVPQYENADQHNGYNDNGAQLYDVPMPELPEYSPVQPPQNNYEYEQPQNYQSPEPEMIHMPIKSAPMPMSANHYAPQQANAGQQYEQVDYPIEDEKHKLHIVPYNAPTNTPQEPINYKMNQPTDQSYSNAYEQPAGQSYKNAYQQPSDQSYNNAPEQPAEPKSYGNDNLSQIDLEEDLPVYAQVPEPYPEPNEAPDYTVGATHTTNDAKESQRAKDPIVGENWFEKEYHRLRQWVQDNVNTDLAVQATQEATTEKNKEIVDEFTTLIKNDLAEGHDLAKSTDKVLDKKISKLIEENIEHKVKAPKLEDKLDKIEEMIETATAPRLINEEQGLNPTNDAVLGEEWKLVDTGEHNIFTPTPSIKNSKQIINPKLLDLKNMVQELKTVPNYVFDRAEKVADLIQPHNHKNQHKLNQNENNNVPQLSQRNHEGTEQNEALVGAPIMQPDDLTADDKNDTVGCSMESLEEKLEKLKDDKDSGELMYLKPYGNGYGYRDSHQPKNKLLADLDKILHPHHSEKDAPNGDPIKDFLHGHARAQPTIPDIIKDIENLHLPTLPPLHLHHQHHHTTTFSPIEEDGRPEEYPANNPNMQVNNFEQQRNFPQQPFQQMPTNNGEFPQNFNNMRSNFQLPPRNSFDANQPILGATPMDNPQFYYNNHFGKIVPASGRDLNIHNRDTNEQTQQQKMYFVGDGIKLPLHMKKHDDGTLHLSVDVHKLCKCNGTACTHPNALAGENKSDTRVGLENPATDENEEDDDDDVPVAMGTPDFEKLRLESNLDELDNDKDVFKRSPRVNRHLEVDDQFPGFNDLDFDKNSNYYDEEHDLISPINQLENRFQSHPRNVKSYQDIYDDESSEKENDEDLVGKRVGLLTNVLSWMKDIAVDMKNNK